MSARQEQDRVADTRVFSSSQHRAVTDSTGQHQTLTVNLQALRPPQQAAVVLVGARVGPRSGGQSGDSVSKFTEVGDISTPLVRAHKFHVERASGCYRTWRASEISSRQPIPGDAMPMPPCDNCTVREATSIYGGRGANGQPWTFAVCSECDPEPGEPQRPAEMPPLPPNVTVELERLVRRFGV